MAKVRKMFKEWCPKQHIKTSTPPMWNFFYGVLTREITFLRISRSICIFEKKVSSKNGSSLNFLLMSTIIGLMVSLKQLVTWVEWVDNIVHSTFEKRWLDSQLAIFFWHRNGNLTYFNFSFREKILKFDIFRDIIKNLSFSHTKVKPRLLRLLLVRANSAL